MASDLIKIEICLVKEINNEQLFKKWKENARIEGESLRYDTNQCRCPGENTALHVSDYKHMHLFIVKTVISNTYKMIGLCDKCSKHTGHIAVWEDSLVDVPQEILNQINLK